MSALNDDDDDRDIGHSAATPSRTHSKTTAAIVTGTPLPKPHVFVGATPWERETACMAAKPCDDRPDQRGGIWASDRYPYSVHLDDDGSFRFPSTSTAFELRPRNSPPGHRFDPHPVIPAQDISAIRSSALRELHQSIIEASEGFVQRMRIGSYLVHKDHARTIVSVLPSFFSETTSVQDDVDDDVFILSDETSSEPPSIPPELSRTLARTVTSSSTSSLLSLSPPVILSPSTREEKAITALTLALANGAAGINDYSAVWEALGASAALAEGASEVGEMAVDLGLDKLGLGSDIIFF
ncbi:hypothetical protein EDB83DRAFT_2310341 [Lactarius deliciosus]|nr:hypothetical protein EDB83DRAFT_2310341 [Lactarius deliciosus]